MKHFYYLSLFVPIVAAGCPRGMHDAVISENGKCLYSIVCPQQSSETVRFAASELEHYLEIMTGDDVCVSDRISGPSIIIGETSVISDIAGFKGIREMTGEDYGLFYKKGNIYLTGAQGRSVLYSVYDFLESAGCVWAAPEYDFYEGRSEYVPQNDNLKISMPSERYESTESPYRKLYITGERTEKDMYALVDWMPKLRYNIMAFKMVGPSSWSIWRDRMLPELEKRGMIVEDGGHGYDFFIGPGMENGKLFEQHPEWFGKNKRWGDKAKDFRSSSQKVVFCTSNEDAVKYMHKNLAAYLSDHPEIDIFDLWPPDSELWCTCDKCQALGTDSDRHALFVSQTAAFLKDRFPDLKMECLAYHHYYEPPVNYSIPENVLVDFADYYQNFEYQFYDDRNFANKMHNAALEKWASDFGGDLSIYSYYCKGFWRSLPNLIPHYIQNDMKYYRSIGVKGISVYSEPKNWFTFGLNLYSIGKLAWNSDIDIEKVISDYCNAVYGEASDLALHAYTVFEEVVRYACVIHQTTFRTDSEYDAYAAKISQLEDVISKREAMLDEGSVVRNHVMRLRLMSEYAGKSIVMMRRLASENRAAKKVKKDSKVVLFDALPGVVTRRPPLDEDLKQWLSEHRGLGVFAE